LGSKGSNTTTTTQKPPEYVERAYQDVIGRAGAAANQPYRTYGGERVAGFSPSQMQAFQTVTDAQGAASPYIDEATGYARMGAAPVADLTSADINRYYSPYQQQVIDATMANINETNTRQQQQVVGNAALQGALGGDRVKVAQAELARQQNLANNKTLADLSSQGFAQAAALAGNQQLLQQQNAQRAGQAAYTFGNLGREALGSWLTGAQAQLQTGAMQQAREQQLLNEPRQDWLGQQAYGFQIPTWLAGLYTGVGSNAGGAGTTIGPPPDRMGQIIGAAGTAAGLALSDERAKEDIELVGELFDGQPVYRFRYRGDPQMQIGLLAQDVEQDNPEAVGEAGGLMGVDYDAATDDAAEAGHFASGGEAGGLGGGIPYAGGVNYVPTIGMTAGRGPPKPPEPPKQSDAAGKGLDALGKGFGNYLGDQADAADAGYYGGSPDGPDANPNLIPYADGGEVPEGNRLAGLVGSIASGIKQHFPGLGGAGLQRPGFDEGGGVWDLEDRWGASFPPPIRDDVPPDLPPDLSPDVSFTKPVTDKFQDRVPAIPYAPSPLYQEDTLLDGGEDVPLPRPRPATEAADNAPPDTRGAGAPREWPQQNDLGVAAAPPPRSLNPPPQGAPEKRGFFDRPFERGGTFENSIFGQGEWKPSMPLLNLGLGMLASKSPNLGNMIGEGGQAAVAQYIAQKRQEGDTAHRNSLLDIQKQRVGFEGQRLTESARQHAAQEKWRNDQIAERERHQREIEKQGQWQLLPGKGPDAEGNIVDGMWEYNRKDNTRNFIPSQTVTRPQADRGPGVDERVADRIAKAQGIEFPEAYEMVQRLKRSGKSQYLGPSQDEANPGSVFMNADGTVEIRPYSIGPRSGAKPVMAIDDETMTAMARQYLAGDRTVFHNLGRGAQAADNIIRLRTRIAEIAKTVGISPEDIAVITAEYEGLKAGNRSLGTRTAAIETAVSGAMRLAPLAVRASDAVDRTQFPSLNAVLLAFEKGVGDENVVRLGIAVNSLINVYARAINPTGVPTVSDKNHARELLASSWSQGQFRAGIDQLMLELESERQAPKDAREQLRKTYAPRSGADQPDNKKTLKEKYGLE
jgi:hypothetical protein